MSADDDEWGPEKPAGTWWDTAKNVGQTADDLVRAAANAITFGMADRFAGTMNAAVNSATPRKLSDLITGGPPRTYEDAVNAEVKKSEEARARSPYASVAGDVAGSVALPTFGAAKLATAATPYVARYVAPRAVDATARAIGYGVTGAGTGALQGAGNTYTGSTSDYVNNAITGGAFGGVLGGVGGAVFGHGPMRSSAVTPKTAEQQAATDLAYGTFRGLPARYTPSSVADINQAAQIALRKAGHFDAPTTHGGSPVPFRVAEQLLDPPTARDAITGARKHISPGDLDVTRKLTTGDRVSGLDPWQLQGAGIVRNKVDDFIANPPPGAVVPGTEAAARQASGIHKTARDLHAGTMRSQYMDDLIENAGTTAGATHAGLNLRNEMQKAVRSGLKSKGGESAFSREGYTAAEQAALREFARGQGKISQSLAYADKYLGGGGGLGAAVAGGLGGAVLGDEGNKTDAALKGLGVSGLGLGLRMLGNRRATTDINRIRDLIAQRNPLYASRVAKAPMVSGPGSPRAAKAMRDALTLEIIKQTQPKRLEINTDEWE